MKLYFLCIIAILLFSCSTTNSPQIASATNEKNTKKIVAILPGLVKIYVPTKDSANIPETVLDEAALKLGFMLQNELYKQVQKNKYTATIQPLHYTNEILFATGRTFASYKNMNEKELAVLLKVDAVIFMKAELKKANIKNIQVYINANSLSNIILSAALTSINAATAKVEQIDNIYLKVGVIEIGNKAKNWSKDYRNVPSSYYSLEEFFKKSLKNISKTIPYCK